MRRIATSIVTFVSWHRRAIGALLAAASVMLLAEALRTPVETVDALVATVALPAGHTITPADVEVRALPPGALPDDSLASPDDAIGRTLAAPVSGSTVLQPGSLANDHRAADGRAIVPIAVSDDGLRALLSPGDRVSLVTQGPDSMVVLCSDAIIVALPSGPDPAGRLADATQRPSTMILVEVPQEDAANVATFGQGVGVSVILGTV